MSRILGGVVALAAGVGLLAAPATALAASETTAVVQDGCHERKTWKSGNSGFQICVRGAGYVQVRITCARDAGGSDYVKVGPRQWSWNNNNPSKATCNTNDHLVKVEGLY